MASSDVLFGFVGVVFFGAFASAFHPLVQKLLGKRSPCLNVYREGIYVCVAYEPCDERLIGSLKERQRTIITFKSGGVVTLPGKLRVRYPPGSCIRILDRGDHRYRIEAAN